MSALPLQESNTSGGTIADLTRAELDQQIATAKRYPRSIKRFVDEATAMVALNESIAQQCIYALPRDGKVIEGPSARFAEIIASAWGNCRAGARVVAEGDEFITAQGVFMDLERNSGIQYEVQRRITDKHGRRYKADMIGVTGNAANSIALRNAILKGVPKAFWDTIYQRARGVIAGDFKTLANRRAAAIQAFVIYGVTDAQLLAKLGRSGIADVSLDDLVILHGMLNALKDGDSTPEELFAPASSGDGPSGIATPRAKATPPPPEAPPTPEPSVVVFAPDQRVIDPVVERDAHPDAAPPAPKREAPPPPADGMPLATTNEKRYLVARAERSNRTIEDVCASAGISDFDRLTADGFIAIKERLGEIERGE